MATALDSGAVAQPLAVAPQAPAPVKPKAPTGATDLPVSPTSQNPTPSTQPVGPTPAPTTPLPLATSDPMAYAPPSGAATNPQAAVQAWDAYSPLSGMTEDQKALYWANQGVPISGGGTSFQSQLGQYLTQPSTPGGSPFATPDAQAGYQSTLSNILGQNASQIQGLNQQVASGTQGAQAALNGSIGAANTASAAAEADAAKRQIQAIGGQYPDSSSAGVPSASPSSAPTPAASSPMSIAPTGAVPSSQGSDVPVTPPTSTGSTGGGFLAGINSAASNTGTTGNPLGYNLSPTDPNNALTSQTITPTGTDFMSQAQKLLASENAANDQQYQANLRDANRYAYSQGRGGSGIENTSLGDIAAQHTLQQNQLGNQLLYGALGQQNANQYANVGIAQQQQGFQNQQQNQAFSQAIQQLLAGSSGDPSQIGLTLAQIFGNQAGGISGAASNYAAQNTANTNSQLQNQQFMDWLKSVLQNGGTSAPTPAVGT